jgi:hypothetical protein
MSCEGYLAGRGKCGENVSALRTIAGTLVGLTSELSELTTLYVDEHQRMRRAFGGETRGSPDGVDSCSDIRRAWEGRLATSR